MTKILKSMLMNTVSTKTCLNVTNKLIKKIMCLEVKEKLEQSEGRFRGLK